MLAACVQRVNWFGGWVLRMCRLSPAGGRRAAGPHRAAAVTARVRLAGNRMLRFHAWNAFHARKRNVWLQRAWPLMPGVAGAAG